MEYKGYSAIITLENGDNIIYGTVVGLKKTAIDFSGTDAESLWSDFRKRVDEYLRDCEEFGSKPEKPTKREAKKDIIFEYGMMQNLINWR